MALALVSVKRGFNTGSNSIGSAAGVHTAGNGLIALVQYQNNVSATISGLANTAGDTWTQIPANSPFQNTGSPANLQACYYVSSTAGHATDVVTATLTANSGYTAIAVYEVSGQNTSSFYVTSSTGASTTGTGIATGTLTLSGNAIIVAIFETDGGATPTTGYSGLTVTDGGAGFVWDMYKLTAASQTASATGAVSGKWGILAAAFAEAGGGATNWGSWVVGNNWNRIVQNVR